MKAKQKFQIELTLLSKLLCQYYKNKKFMFGMNEASVLL